MSILTAMRARMRALFRRRRADDELSEEIRFHIEKETEGNLRRGMPPEEARRVALAHFGGVQRVREEHRDVRRLQWAEDFVSDARFALRALRRTPALTGAAIVTLALGIGANVAIFSAVNAVVLQPLPFPNSDRLMVITEENPEKHWHLQLAAPANMLDWASGVKDFASVMGYVGGIGDGTLTGHGAPQVMRTQYVTGNFFSTLGVRAALGRTLTDDESWDTGTHVAVLSDRAWRDHFGADPSVVGTSVVIEGQTVEIVGVMAPGFSYPEDGIDLWRSVEWQRADAANAGFRRAHWLRVVARLRPGASPKHANAELQAVVARLKTEFPATNKYMGAAMMPLHDFLVGDTRVPLLVLLTSVAFLLLIACANVGNLLLVQAAGRARESALRLALGAGRARLVRQAFAESFVLSVIGAGAGLALGWFGTHVLVRLAPIGMLRVSEFGVDTTVLSYVVAITIAAAVLFGVAPALQARHRHPASALKDGGRASAHPGGVRAKRWGDLLVVGEVALALLMAVGAGLLVRSFVRVTHIDPGFDGEGVFVGEIALSRQYDTIPRVDAFLRDLETRLKSTPGVADVAFASSVPYQGTSYTTDFIAYGRPEGGYGTEIGNRVVSPSYFELMKVPVLRGRAFTDADRLGGQPVVVINDVLANSYFKGEDPIGQRIAFDKVPTPKSTWYTIVGVVRSERVKGLDSRPIIEAFQSTRQSPLREGNVVLRTNGDPAALAEPFRTVLQSLDANLTPLHVSTMAELRRESLARIRFLTTMLIVFAVIGVILSVVGVYGVLAHTSRNRTREMGIRIALGAQASQVRWLVVNQGLRLTAIGLALGTLIALFATRLMATVLFDVAPNDPVTMVSVALLLAATSAVAAWIPAVNASRADPASALRTE